LRQNSHFGDVLPSQSLGLVLKKLFTQQKQTTPEHNGKKNTEKVNLNL